LVHRKEHSFYHNCPFCKTINFKLCVDIDIPVIIKFFEKNEDIFIKNTSKLTEKMININAMLNNDYFNTFFSKPNKSSIVTPTILLYARKLD
jgi:hypothetical protein